MDHRTQEWNATAAIMTASAPEVPTGPRLEPRCKVCMASMTDLPNGAAIKNLVEELLLVPRTYASIVRTVEPLTSEWPQEARFSADSLARHARRHLAWEESTVREVADRHAENVAGSREATGRMLTAGTVFEVVQQRGVDLLLEDELRPSVKDVLVATKALHELEQEAAGDFSVAHLYSQMDRIITIFREELPEEIRERIMARILDEERAVSASSVDPAWEGIERELEADRP